MRRTTRLYSFALICLALACTSALSQNSQSYLNDIGSTAYGVNIPVENGFINISNGNLHLEFSLASSPQRGALKLNERIVYDSRIWMFSPFGSNGSYHWWPYNVPGAPQLSGGWRFVTGAETGTISYGLAQENLNTQNCIIYGGDSNDYESVGTLISQIIWTDPSGTTHLFNAEVVESINNCTGSDTQTISGGSAADGSGYAASDDGAGSPVITDNSGNQVYPQHIDRFGNYWSTDSNGNLVDDTGRVPVIVTQNGNTTYYDVLAPNGTINNNGTRVRYTVTSASVPVATNFQQSDVYEWNPTVPYLTPVQSILLPDGSQFTFSYDSYGGLSSVTLPTGGVVQYGYTNFVDSSNTANRWLSSRTQGSNPPMTFTPSVVTTCSNYSTGCVESINLHKPSGDETIYQLTLANGAWNTAVTAYTGSAASGQELSNTTNVNTYTNGCSNAVVCSGANYLSQSLSTTVLYANGSPSVSTQAQSLYNVSVGKIRAFQEWDYGADFNGTPTRETDYVYTGFDPSVVTVKDQNGNKAGQTTYGYTSNATVTSGVTQHGSANAGGPYLQTVSQWLNTGGSSTTAYGMDDTGMVTSVTDPKSNPPSTVAYQCGNSLPYQMSNALGQTTTYGYDCDSGAITSVKDPNDSAAGRSGTIYQYEPVAGRLQSVSYPDGGQTNYSYPSPIEVDTAVLATPDPTVSSQTIVDSFRRPYQQITAGVSSETTYDANGRVNCVTNPHFTNSSSSTDGSTCVTAYDGVDRPKVQTQPDGNVLSWSYSGNATTSTDEAGNSWRRTNNAFGQLTSVAEPGNLLTSYTYDGLGNVLSATQNGVLGETPRTRSFTYDSLSRLTTATNPETGPVSYSYLTSGAICAGDVSLPCSKMDARGITTSYGYDVLNRLIAKTHSDTTPSACFRYDSAPTNGIGRLASEWTQAGSCPSTGGPPSSALTNRVMTAYDPMGRLKLDEQCPWTSCSNVPNMQYGFDLAGNRTFLTDIGGATIGSSYDNAGRLTNASSTLVDANHPATLFTANSYGPAGLLTSTLGNGMNEVRSYDNRSRLLSYSVSAATTPAGTAPPFGIVSFARNHENGLSGLPQNGILDVQGWAESNAGCPLETVEIDIDSTPIGLAHLGDIVYGTTYINCGFDFSGAIGDIAPGNHTVNVYGYDFSGNKGLLYNHWPITVSQNTPPSGDVNYAINAQTQTSNLTSGGLMNVVGWAIDSQMNAPVGAVKVWVDGTPIGYATLGLSRPDVASASNNQQYLNSGWSFTGTIGDLSPGTHRVGVTIYDTGGQEVSPPSVPTITVSADTSTVNGGINALNGQVVGSTPLPPNSAITVIGWSAELNTTPCATVTRVDLFADDHFLGTAQVGLPRQDVVDVYGNQNCLNSGWSFTGTLAGVDPGQHILLARAYDQSGGSKLLDPRPQIMVSSTMPPASVANPSPTQYAFSLGYGPNGNVDYSYDSVNGNWAYLYDGLNRLSAAGSAQNSLAWNYDSFGNRLAQTVTGGSGFANEQSFQSNTNRTDQDCYDSAGNLINTWGWGCWGGPYIYSYDAEGRMVSSDWGNTTYTYDAEGRRVAKASGGAATNYYFYDDRGHTIAQYNGSGNLILRDIYAGERHLVTYADQQWTTVFPLTDWLGTERARSDVTGNLCQTTTSQPFGDGQQINGSCAPGNKFFTGLERDSESGLDHAMFRQYSSPMGRWMSPDPYNGSMDINYPQTFNRYAYVGNMPLSYTDPSGLLTCGTCGGGGGDNGITAILATVFVDGFEALFNAFDRPTFKGSTQPRPSGYKTYTMSTYTSIVNTDQVGLLYKDYLTTVLGLGKDILFRKPWDAPLRLFGTRYCGPGGAGDRSGHINGLCAIHDDCFSSHKLSFAPNLGFGAAFTAEEAAFAKACNEDLFYGVRQFPNDAGSQSIQLWLQYGDKLPLPILAPGTSVTPIQ